MALLAFLFPKEVKKEEGYPFVTVLLSVYNEKHKVEERVRNLLDQDYPSEKLEILVGSDGSTDGTNDILVRLEQSRVNSYIFEERRGKPSVINDLVEKARGQILVFVDCRQKNEKDSIKILVENFADKKVGIVSGQVFEGNEGFYRRYENFVRLQEAKWGSIPGTCGPFYGVRAELVNKIQPDIILDDFIIPMEVIRSGFRSVVEGKAIVQDITFSLSQERVRKTRTIAGNFQVFIRYPWLLNPIKNPAWLQAVSHKLLRLLAPIFCFLLLVSNLFILSEGIGYKLLFILQVLLYLFGSISHAIFWGKKEVYPKSIYSRVFLLMGTFLELNIAIVLGARDFFMGKSKVTWTRYDKRK